MKNILIVMNSLYNGGAEKSLVNFLNEIPPQKYNIDLLLFKEEGMFLEQVPKHINRVTTSQDIKILYGNPHDAGWRIIIKLVATIISRVLAKGVHSQKGFRWHHFYSKRLKIVSKVYDIAIAYTSGEIMYYIDEKVVADKKVVFIHNDYKSEKYSKKHDYDHLRNMSSIISISQTCVDVLKEEFPEFKDKIMLLPNISSSIVIKKRSNEFIPAEYSSFTTNILSIGRLCEQKGFDLAIKAAYILKQSSHNFKWFIIGTGKLRVELQEQVNTLGLHDTFIFLGSKSNPYPYISNCSILVQSSRYEGKSVVIDEAKILGKPIVATKYPTINDQINEHEGIIVGLDATEIANGILQMLKSGTHESYSRYLLSKEYGNQDDINLYINLLGN